MIGVHFSDTEEQQQEADQEYHEMAEIKDTYIHGKIRRRRSDESVNSGYQRDLY